MKVAAICEAIKAINGGTGGNEIQHLLVHADGDRSDSFFNDLELPKPDVYLEVGSASDSVQTARIMERFETVILSDRTWWWCWGTPTWR
jgi:UDP-N-acetylglucosamine 2-epimerase (non-hydrolysing)